MPLTEHEKTITGVVERATPSVVGITTVEILRDARYRPFPREGIGSGVILSGDGLIVTNHHVVRDARAARMALSDGRRLEARLVGGDPESDLALLRVEANDLVPARLADTSALQVGQTAIAIGNPYGQILDGPTVTVGVVSALHRTLRLDGGSMDDLLQTDAPINPGNSGGALLDTEGRVIGINTAIIPYAQGIGFAVPSNLVQQVAKDLLAHGRVRRPWLGVYGITLTPRIARRHDLRTDRGVLVLDVEPDSPADLSGLRNGDVLTQIGAQRIASVDDLRRLVAARQPEEALPLHIVRGDRTIEAKARLTERAPRLSD